MADSDVAVEILEDIRNEIRGRALAERHGRSAVSS